jgi:hypothetical protein
MDEIARDVSGDATSDIIWMTYAELGRSRRISAASAKRLAIRRHWRRHQGNDGTARVAVPVTEAVRREPPPRDSASDDPGDNAGDVAFATALAAIEAAHSGEARALRERADVAERRADAADADRRQAEVRAHEAEQGRDLANTLADELRAQLETARQQSRGAAAATVGLRDELAAAQIAQAEAEADAAELRQAEAARKGQGCLTRLKAAWRGE